MERGTLLGVQGAAYLLFVDIAGCNIGSAGLGIIRPLSTYICQF